MGKSENHSDNIIFGVSGKRASEGARAIWSVLELTVSFSYWESGRSLSSGCSTVAFQRALVKKLVFRSLNTLSNRLASFARLLSDGVCIFPLDWSTAYSVDCTHKVHVKDDRSFSFVDYNQRWVDCTYFRYLEFSPFSCVEAMHVIRYEKMGLTTKDSFSFFYYTGRLLHIALVLDSRFFFASWYKRRGIR